MTAFVNLNIDIIAIFICAAVLFSMQHKIGMRYNGNRIIRQLILLNMVILLFDSLMKVLLSRRGLLNHAMLTGLTALLFLLQTVPPVLCALFIRFHLYRERPLRRAVLPLLLPAASAAVLILCNFRFGIIYKITESNRIETGYLFYAYYLLNYSYILYSIIITLIKRKNIGRNKASIFIICCLFTVLGFILQIVFKEIAYIWVLATLALLTFYFYMQNCELFTDYLTGISNRLFIDYLLIKKIKKAKNGVTFAGMMIDIDNFKEINDKYGHNMGDKALEATARLLKLSISRNDFLARIGGDEFIIITDASNASELIKTVDAIQSNVVNFNESSKKPYTLSLSFGFDLYDPSLYRHRDQFIRHIDSLMYQNKRSKKLSQEACI